MRLGAIALSCFLILRYGATNAEVNHGKLVMDTSEVLATINKWVPLCEKQGAKSSVTQLQSYKTQINSLNDKLMNKDAISFSGDAGGYIRGIPQHRDKITVDERESEKDETKIQYANEMEKLLKETKAALEKISKSNCKK